MSERLRWIPLLKLSSASWNGLSKTQREPLERVERVVRFFIWASFTIMSFLIVMVSRLEDSPRKVTILILIRASASGGARMLLEPRILTSSPTGPTSQRFAMLWAMRSCVMLACMLTSHTRFVYSRTPNFLVRQTSLKTPIIFI